MPEVAAPYGREDFRRVTGATLRPGGLALTERALAVCRFPPGSRVLDLGCGPGATLARLVQAGMAAVGLDVATAFAREASGSAATVCGRGQALPVRTACLDGVFCECVLSACGDAPAVLAEIGRVLRPGGLLALSDLYIRAGAPAPDGYSGCAAGAVSRETRTGQLAAAGLRLLSFEDHTRLLTELACRLTFALGSVKSVIAMITGRDPACQSANGPRPRFGYCLMLAAKETS